MELLLPQSLYLLGLIPLLVLAYIWILRRRKPLSVRFSSLSLLRDALPKQSKWKRHLPFALFLLALSSLTVAMARPVSTITVPATNATILLAIDVSRSMCSTDIEPNRLEAAKAAALEFVKLQDANTQIGIVAFAGYAVIVQAPTTDKALLETAIKNLTTARRTAIGEGILMSLDAISEIDDSVPSPYSGVEPAPLAEDEYVPAIIVLLTDGVTTTGTHPLLAANMAAERGVRVFTIGFGTVNNTSPMNCSVSSPYFQFGDQFSGPFFSGGGGGFRRELDEATLKAVAEMTGGAYHLAESSEELREVYENLPVQLITVTETTEVAVMFAAIAAALVTLALALALIWNPLL
jgi:Ca-activated chloride channel family protein